MPRPPEKVAPAAALAAAVAAAFAMRIICFSALTGYDEFAYARIASDIADGIFKLSDVSGYYGFRYLITFPAALFNKILGDTSYSAAAWPLLCSLGNTLLAYFLGQELFGRRAGIIAAFFQAFLPVSVIYGTMLYPEEILVFWTGLSALLFLKGSARPGRWGGAALLALSGLCVGLGWHVRLNAAVMLVVYAVWTFRFGFRPAHMLLAAGFIAALVPDWGACWAATGDPFFSLRTQLSKLATDTDVYPAGHLVYLRGLLGLDLYGLALFGFYFYFFAAAAAVAAWRKDLTRLLVPLSWFGGLLLYFEFGPASLYPYEPVHKQLRFLSIAFFPVIITAAQFVSGFRTARMWAAVVFILASSGLASWKMMIYNGAKVAPYQQVAAYILERSPSAVYAEGGLANFLGYYTRDSHTDPYYLPAGAAAGYIKPLRDALSTGSLSGACAVVDLSAGKGFPPALAGMEKISMEIPGNAGVYCFK
jgi:4-amino-4-deoxy-L-arabinose transferase-like glycosyltransferase